MAWVNFLRNWKNKTYTNTIPRNAISATGVKLTCPECKGSRLRQDASYVKINGKSITDVGVKWRWIKRLIFLRILN